MSFGARILADSVSPDGVRLSTFEMEFPRYIQAEVNTHRILSKNSASSRAIPVEKMLERLKADPYLPVYWGSNKPGMQAGEELSQYDQMRCERAWLAAMDDNMNTAGFLRDVGLHKQDANRLLEPWMWQTVIITGTEWDNFWHLRNHADAHPAFQTVVSMMQEQYEELPPTELQYGQWHVPLVCDDSVITDGMPLTTLEGDDVESWRNMVKLSVGRCARTSLLTHDGERDPRKDIQLHDKLLGSGHLSPFEHQARPAADEDTKTAMFCNDNVHIMTEREEPYIHVWPRDQWHGNFRGWVQYRKTIPGEADIMGHMQAQQ